MATTEVTKAINDLKTDADKLAPKPSIVFYNIHKAQCAAVKTAAAAIDKMVEGTDASDAPATLKTFTDAATKYFTNLGNVAAKEPATIKAKLKTLVDGAEKEALAVGKGEVEHFVQAMAGRPRADKNLDGAPIKALQDHIALRKRGLKETQDHLVVAKKTLADMKLNRAKGQAGLIPNQTLLKNLRSAEVKVAQGGDFLKGREALAKNFREALDKGAYPKDLVAGLRKEDGEVFDTGMRVMAEAREVRTEAIKELGEHEFDVEQIEVGNLKDDNARLDQIKKVGTAVDTLLNDTGKLVGKLDKEAGWGKIKNMTDANQESGYKAKLDEATEAFRALPAVNTTLVTLTKRIELLRGKEASRPVLEAVNVQQSKLARVRGQLKIAGLAYPQFKTMVSDCEKIWSERELNAV